MTKIEQKESIRQEYITAMREQVIPGSTIYTVLRHVSSSGMSRDIDLFFIKDNQPMRMSYKVAQILGYPLAKNNDGIKVGGAGMDMGFSVVYNLGRALFPDGFTLAKNQHGRNGDTSGYDNDGGYALRQEWL